MVGVLGMGRDFTTVHSLRGLSVGQCHVHWCSVGMPKEDGIPTEPHDAYLDGIVTNRRFTSVLNPLVSI